MNHLLMILMKWNNGHLFKRGAQANHKAITYGNIALFTHGQHQEPTHHLVMCSEDRPCWRSASTLPKTTTLELSGNLERDRCSTWKNRTPGPEQSTTLRRIVWVCVE